LVPGIRSRVYSYLKSILDLVWSRVVVRLYSLFLPRRSSPSLPIAVQSPSLLVILVNYIGSKYSLLGFLQEGIETTLNGSKGGTFLDIFAGTGTVGRHFKERGYRVVANDIQYYAFCINRALIGINRPPKFASLLQIIRPPKVDLFDDPIDTVLSYLNSLNGTEGFVFRNYCPGGTKDSDYTRQYYTDENGKKCDAIRQSLNTWRSDGVIDDDEFFYLLASLIDGVDRVANTASIYGAFLKHIKKTAQKELVLRRLDVVESECECEAYNEEGVQLAAELPCDILYMDPPYNQRQYCANYHVLETIARYDSPSLKGVTGLRPYQEQKSKWCAKKHVASEFDQIVKATRARHVFLSYNSEGLMSREVILATMSKYGDANLLTKDYGRFRADIDRENRVYKADRVEEYLFCLDKGPT